MKRPAFQFYPADWRKDVELQSCSMAAQGLWINAMCLAHECEPYGYLTVNGKPMSVAQLGRQVGLSAREAQLLVNELIESGVARRSDQGAIYSKRMVDDEDLRNRRAAGGNAGAEHGVKGAKHGAKGGRPVAAKGGEEGGSITPLAQTAKPPPSSSSSSSPSGEEIPPTSLTPQPPPDGDGTTPDKPAKASRGERLPKEWQLPRGWGEWAVAKYPHWTRQIVVDIALSFRNHWTAKTGKDATKLDWEGTWQNWCMSAITQKQYPPPQAGATRPLSFRERDADVAAQRIARLTGGMANAPLLDQSPQETIDVTAIEVHGRRLA
jgi:hypothetical protein